MGERRGTNAMAVEDRERMPWGRSSFRVGGVSA